MRLPALEDVCLVAGTAALTYAGYQLHPAAGWAVGGALVLLIGFLLAVARARERATNERRGRRG